MTRLTSISAPFAILMLLCKEKNIKILERTVVNLKHEGSLWMRLFPNLLGEIAIYHIARS